MAPFDLETLRTLADEGVARHGLRAYARKLGVDLGLLRSLRDGRDIQTSKSLELIRAMGMQAQLSPARAVAPADGFADPAGSGASDAPTPEALHSGYLPIPYHEAARRYGAAAPVAFHRDWLAQLGVATEALRCLDAPHDGFAPNIAPGATCLLDTADSPARGHGLWAYVRGNRVALAYLSQPAPGTMVIQGPQPCQPPELQTGPALDDLRLLGRIIWHGSRMGAPQG